MESISQKKFFNLVFTWGLGGPGALGNNSEVSSILPYNVKIKEDIIQVSSGMHTSMCLTESGSIYSFGSNEYGRIGLSDIKETRIPKLINNITKFTIISCGKWHSLALSNQNHCFSTGYNKNGELGLGDTNNRLEFVEITSLDNINKISAGTISLFLTSNNKLYSTGKGKLNGHKDGKNRIVPTLIESLKDEKITDINSGFVHSACTNDNGKIFTWGEGNEYQLGHGNKNRLQTPEKIEGFGAFIVQVSCSVGEVHAHTGCIDSEGKVFTWGNGYKCKLGHDDDKDIKFPKQIISLDKIKVKKISCGGIHTGILTVDGKIYTFGCGSDGRLGHPESERYRYLYKEKIPREIDALKNLSSVDLSCSYYHCISLGNKNIN